MSDALRIVVVDSQPLFRAGVVRVLEESGQMAVVGEGATADDACRLARNLAPDILMLDSALPGGGLSTARAIAAACPGIKTILMSLSEAAEDVRAAFKAQVRAYVLRTISPRDLVGVLQRVHDGEVYVTPTLMAALLPELAGGPSRTRLTATPLDELTERERQILELVASGFSNKEIGQRLYLSEKTIKHYMTNVLQKLQVRNRVEAALLAQRSGPLSEPRLMVVH